MELDTEGTSTMTSSHDVIAGTGLTVLPWTAKKKKKRKEKKRKKTLCKIYETKVFIH